MPEPWREELSARFLAHYGSLRGIVRRELTARQLDAHLPSPPGRLLDVGAGDGYQGIRLARNGYEVMLVDPSAEMVATAERALRVEDEATRSRTATTRASADDCLSLFGEASFDGVLCHGVVMYQESAAPMIGTLARLVRPGGLVSLVAKNADALAMRPALEGRWSDALAAFAAREDVGGLGVPTRGDTLSDLLASFDRAEIDPLAWYGLRVLTDHLGSMAAGDDLGLVIEVEWHASGTGPYRAVGRLIHLIGRRRSPSA